MTTGEKALPQPSAELPDINAVAPGDYLIPQPGPEIPLEPAAPATRDEAWIQSLCWVLLAQAGQFLWDFWAFGPYYLVENPLLDTGSPWFDRYFGCCMVLTLPATLMAVLAYLSIRVWPALRRISLALLFALSITIFIGFILCATSTTQMSFYWGANSPDNDLQAMIAALYGLPNLVCNGYLSHLAFRQPTPKVPQVCRREPSVPSPLVLLGAYLLTMIGIRLLALS